MPRDSDGKKIDELEKLTANMGARLDNAINDIAAVVAEQSKMVRELADVRREYEKEIALLK